VFTVLADFICSSILFQIDICWYIFIQLSNASMSSHDAVLNDQFLWCIKSLSSYKLLAIYGFFNYPTTHKRCWCC